MAHAFAITRRWLCHPRHPRGSFFLALAPLLPHLPSRRNPGGMNIDSDVANMLGQVLAVNAGAVLLLAALSYGASVLMLEGVAALDRWLDPSRHAGKQPLPNPGS